jgi:DNA repair exonuclease SbcCD ATPase subunit
MSEIVEIIDTLEERLKKLVQKLVILEQKNSELSQELSKVAVLFKNQSQQIEELKKQNESLKIAKSLLGSDENKRDTKLKINSLIREIDYCIAQLAD